MYQLQSRLSDVLNYPLPDRIRQLMMCVETVPIKDLQNFYPSLVSHIFGFQANPGWGLRTVTEQMTEWRMLYEFFHPHGAFFQMIYRLLKDTVKFDLKIIELPVKLRQMLESGQHTAFYKSILNVENFQPRNFSLSLNAFDFFLFNFCIHGLKNFHKISPAALAVNNENSKTVFYCLTADYLCNFLPSDPNSVIFPQIDCSPLKQQPTMPMPSLNPTKPTKYLLLSALSHQPQNPTNTRADIRLPEFVWRSESVMMIFTDCWLRYNIDESWELPSNEFIKLVRILVKQLQYFGNVAEQDMSSMAILRQQSQTLLNLRMYPFLKAIISRWPLDTSFLNVLELWLSYIQPWRYIYNRNIQSLNNDTIEIPERFKVFIQENLHSYTQIFVRLIPRFIKMDLGATKNAYMCSRMMKVFRSFNDILRQLEKQMNNNNNSATTQSFNDNSAHSMPRSPNSFNRSGDRSPHSHYRTHNQSAIEDSNYIFMFSDEVTLQIYELMQKMYVAKVRADRDIEKMQRELIKHTSLWDKFLQFVGWLSTLSLSFNMTLEDKRKTPMYLDFCLSILSPTFGIDIEDATRQFQDNDSLLEDSDDDNASKIDSEYLNITPSFMRQRMQNITYTGDPFLLPIMGHEVKFLVRFLYQVSSRINEMFENEFDALWHRGDFYGKFSRQILSPPVETRVFDKSAGYSQLKVEQLGPRLSLRKLASWKSIALLIFVFVFGRMFFGASSLGFFAFAIIFVGFLFIKAALSR